MFPFSCPTWLPSRRKTADLFVFLKVRYLPSLRDVLLTLGLAVAVVVPPILLILLLCSAPVGALGEASGSDTFLGALLGAQAAIAALTLAVMLFLMQGISTRRDVDDRVYAEYVRRSWVWPVFLGSIGAVAVTGAVLTAERLVGDAVPGIPNLTLLAVVALVASLAAPVALFARVIRLAEPEHWQSLRLDVNKREVSEAVGAFLGRVQRAVIAHLNNEADFSVLVPDPGERSADQAIRALLDDARRAMDERRHGELTRSLNSIKTLVSFAMDEIEKAGVEWGMPGSEGQWPPLVELRRNLYSYREEVIRAGNRDYLQELLNLDYWFVSTGLRRPCGELFTFGLNGYRLNYEISARIGSRDLHGMLRDRFLMNLDGLTFGHEPEVLGPFMREVIRHQENVLSHALHENLVDDYLWLHREFGSILSNILQRRNEGDVRSFGEEPEHSSLLAQEYRVAMMGLTGRAAILSDSGDLSDATPYLDVARALYRRSTDLADDVVAALRIRGNAAYSQWHHWDIPDHLSSWSGSLSPERYPLTCFAVLLMAMTEDATLTLNLRGNAQYVLVWFLANSDRLERFVRDTPSASAEQRREFATEVLKEAVRMDEKQEDLKIINRELSAERIGAFRDGVHRGMQKAGSVERMFEQAGALVRLVVGLIELPELGFSRLLPKAYFVDPADGDQIYSPPIDGDDWGRGLSQNVVDLLCEEMDGATRRQLLWTPWTHFSVQSTRR